MVRFSMSPTAQQQQSPPHSPASPQKQTLHREALQTAQMKQLSPPPLVEHNSPESSTLSSPPSPLPLPSALLTLPSPLGSSLRLMVTFPFGNTRRRDFENNKERLLVAQHDDVNQQDLSLPHLTMTHDENPFLSCDANNSTSPCCPLVERRRALEAVLHNHHQQQHNNNNNNMKENHHHHNHATNTEAHMNADHHQKSQEEEDEEAKSEVSSISIDSRRLYEVMAMNDAAAAAGAVAVNGESLPAQPSAESIMSPPPPVPFEICIRTTKINNLLPPVPLWLRLDIDTDDDENSQSWSSPLRGCYHGGGGDNDGHRRSSSAGDAFFAAAVEASEVAAVAAVAAAVQPSRSMVRPTLRKNQTVPAPPAASTRSMHWKSSKENVSPTKSKSSSPTTSSNNNRQLVTPRILLLETSVEQRQRQQQRQQRQQQQQQDALLGNRPRRIDASPNLSPNGGPIITIGSIVGQSSLSLLTPTLSTTSVSQKSGDHDENFSSEHQQQQQQQLAERTPPHRRKPSTLTFLSNMATTPVRRLLPSSSSDQHNKVDLRRAKGCLT